MPAAFLAAASGAVMVITQEEWDWESPFVWLGITIAALSLIIGVVVNKPAIEAAIASAQEGNMPEVASTLRRRPEAGKRSCSC